MSPRRSTIHYYVHRRFIGTRCLLGQSPFHLGIVDNNGLRVVPMRQNLVIIYVWSLPNNSLDVFSIRTCNEAPGRESLRAVKRGGIVYQTVIIAVNDLEIKPKDANSVLQPRIGFVSINLFCQEFGQASTGGCAPG